MKTIIEENQNNIIEILRKYSQYEKGFINISSPPGTGKSYGISKVIAEKMANEDRRIIYVNDRLKNIQAMEEAIVKALKNKKLKSKILNIKSYIDNIISNFGKIPVNSVVCTWQEYIKLKNKIIEIEHNSKYDNYKYDIDEFAKIESAFRRKLSKTFKKEYSLNKKKYGTPYAYMKKSPWKFIGDVYPLHRIKKSQVILVTSTRFNYICDPIIEEKLFIGDEDFIKKALIIFDESDIIKRDFQNYIIGNTINIDLHNIYHAINKALKEKDKIDDEIRNLKGLWPYLMKVEDRCNEIEELYYPLRWEVQYYGVDKDQEYYDVEKPNFVMSYKGKNIYYFDSNNLYYHALVNSDLADMPSKFKKNKIIASKYAKYNEAKVYKVANYIWDLQRFVINVLRRMYNFALQYKEFVRETDGEKEISIQDAISTILHKINFNKEVAEELVHIVMALGRNRFNLIKMSRSKEDDYYLNGISYCSLGELEKFHKSIIPDLYFVATTPEAILLDLCHNGMVIALSATSSARNINNFNLEFLRRNLYNPVTNKSTFYLLTQAEKEKIFNNYIENNSGKNMVKTDVRIAGKDWSTMGAKKVLAQLAFGNTEEQAQRLIDNNRYCKYYDAYKNLINDYTNVENSYDYERLVKIWGYLETVINHKVCRNGIIFTSKKIIAKSGTPGVLSEENIKLGAYYIIFNYLRKKLKKELEYRDNIFEELNDRIEAILEGMFVILTSKEVNKEADFKGVMERIADRVREDKWTFMLTTYASVSRGNNLQIPIGKEKIKEQIKAGILHKINNRPLGDCVDWDSMYLDSPTYIVSNLVDLVPGVNDEHVRTKDIKLTFCRLEEFYSKNEITSDEQRDILSLIFEVYNGSRRYMGNGPYGKVYVLNSVKNEYAVIIYQASGRITRTNVRKSEILYVLDDRLIGKVQDDSRESGIEVYTNEFRQILAVLKAAKENLENDLSPKINMEFKKKNEKSYKYLQLILSQENNRSTGWSLEAMKHWERLKTMCLQFPVIDKENFNKLLVEFSNNIYAVEMGANLKNIYLKMIDTRDSYYFGPGGENYSTHNDYKDIIIGNTKDLLTNYSEDFPYAVSKEASRLNIFLTNNVIREYWQKNNYSLEWKIAKGEYYGIINPIMFNNVYKGAVGEEIIRAVLLNAGIRCENIRDPRLFEVFDLVIKGGARDIYVDCKNYSEYTKSLKLANEELYQKLFNKSKLVEDSIVMGINALDEQGDGLVFAKGKIICIPGLMKLDQYDQCVVVPHPEKENYTMVDKIKELIYE